MRALVPTGVSTSSPVRYPRRRLVQTGLILRRPRHIVTNRRVPLYHPLFVDPIPHHRHSFGIWPPWAPFSFRCPRRHSILCASDNPALVTRPKLSFIHRIINRIRFLRNFSISVCGHDSCDCNRSTISTTDVVDFSIKRVFRRVEKRAKGVFVTMSNYCKGRKGWKRGKGRRKVRFAEEVDVRTVRAASEVGGLRRRGEE